MTDRGPYRDAEIVPAPRADLVDPRVLALRCTRRTKIALGRTASISTLAVAAGLLVRHFALGDGELLFVAALMNAVVAPLFIGRLYFSLQDLRACIAASSFVGAAALLDRALPTIWNPLARWPLLVLRARVAAALGDFPFAVLLLDEVRLASRLAVPPSSFVYTGANAPRAEAHWVPFFNFNRITLHTVWFESVIYRLAYDNLDSVSADLLVARNRVDPRLLDLARRALTAVRARDRTALRTAIEDASPKTRTTLFGRTTWDRSPHVDLLVSLVLESRAASPSTP